MNQDQAAANNIARTKKGAAYEILKGTDILKPEFMKKKISECSDILGSPTSVGRKDSQWLSLPGQSQAGLTLEQATAIFKKAIEFELSKISAVRTPQGNLKVQ